MQGTNRRGEGGEKRLPCDPGSELRLLLKGEDNKRDGKKEEKRKKAIIEYNLLLTENAPNLGGLTKRSITAVGTSRRDLSVCM